MQYTQPYDQIDPNASYVNGNPSTGTQGSIIPAGAIEQDQRELVNAILGAGLTPSSTDVTQLYQAMLIGGFSVAGGTPNAIIATLGTSPGAYKTGQIVRLKITSTNTGPVTVNVNNLGVKSIVNSAGAALGAGALALGAVVELRYDGTNFQLSSATGSSGILYGTDTGTANAVQSTIAGVPATLVAGAAFFIKKAASANTGAMTVTINGTIGPYALINADGSAIVSGEIGSGYLMQMVFDGTSMRFMNGATTTAVGSLTANAGEGIGVNGSAVVSLNFPSLAAPATDIKPGDLLALYSQADAHHRGIALSSLNFLFPPTGAIQPYAGASAPVGWLMCSGQAVSRTTYAALFAVVGSAFGAGDGSTTFNVPDLRGEFLRGADNGRGIDSGRTLGSEQTDALKSHRHYTFALPSGMYWNGAGGTGPIVTGQPLNATFGPIQNKASATTEVTGDVETRPRNVAVNFLIKT